jgi:hypothetical protein
MPKSQEIFCLPSLWHSAIRVEAYRAQNALVQCHNCQQFGRVWANCKQPPHCLWCGGTRTALRRVTHLPTQLAATAGWQKEKNPIPSIIGAAEKEFPEDTQDQNRKGVLFHPHPYRCPSRQHSEVAESSSGLRHARYLEQF